MRFNNLKEENEMNTTEREQALIEVNEFLLKETQRLQVEVDRLKAQLVAKKQEKNSKIVNEPPGTIHCDHHCV